MRTALIIPTYEASPHLDALLPALSAQTFRPDSVLVIDSESTDDTVTRCKSEGFHTKIILRPTFNHGGTRRMATELVKADLYLFLTQDAIPDQHDSLEKLVQPFIENPKLGAAYGRQLPHHGAKPLEAFARAFNYPDTSYTRGMEDAPLYGIKTCFASDSFAAYRAEALQETGGFPPHVICTEDAYVFGRMLLAGWQVRYEASATVRHSHAYTLLQQLKRYFDTGVFYGRERWLAEAFGTAGGEGLRFIRDEIRWLSSHGYACLIPYAFCQNAAKIIGYRLGKLEHKLPLKLKKTLSAFPPFWEQEGSI